MSATTRWWWIRHAPVDSGGRIYGQGDLPADCSDRPAFEGLAALLPEDPVWVITNLQRTRQTAQAILDHLAAAPEPLVEPLLAEQHFGHWQGLSHAELAERRDGAWHRFWLAPATEAPPGGESFVQVVARVHSSVRRLSAEHAGRDIVAVAHGGTIRAALALALGLDPERALALSVDNCSLTRVDHIAGPVSSVAPASEQDEAWRVVRVNQAPYMNSGSGR
ncbi:MAG: histidine phosphatase family protein [Rhodospirillales bacterium]|nr:histidine phosphatase family protein [Rhodospirillales bacterium]